MNAGNALAEMQVITVVVVLMAVLMVMVMGMIMVMGMMVVVTMRMVVGMFQFGVAAAANRAHYSTSNSLIRMSPPPVTCKPQPPQMGQASPRRGKVTVRAQSRQ